MFISGALYPAFFLFRRFNRLKVSSLQKPPAFSLTPCIQRINKTLDFFYLTVYNAKFLRVFSPYTTIKAAFLNGREGCRCVLLSER
jgi:hypothetical protein